MTEQDLEQKLIRLLGELKYTYRPDIRDRASLEQNFRQKFEELNRVHLTDSEFKRLLDEIVSGDVFANATLLRERNDFIREDGTPLNYTLVNIKDWCKNSFEVVNQLRINTDYSHHRYDVILLISGVPVVQIELKTLDIHPRRAMEQIVEYKNDPGNGYTRTLLCFMQLFIVSNRSDTLYFANNNAHHFSFNAEERFLPVYRYADRNNSPIAYLDDFAETFLAKCTLAQMISRYMVLVASEQQLLMMRPYQVYAVKEIVESIRQQSGNGYVWHTTGSGKTLTSFKASTLLKENENIEKCLFVVDRKDLDRQTREEFNRFQENCVEDNTNTETLVRRLLSDDYTDKVIVTTIQKLGIALDGNHNRNYKQRLEPLSDKRMVFIFDECHRSQFGDNHKAIREFFPNAQLFGFTGTPIFEENATQKRTHKTDGSEDEQTWLTTEDVFKNQLHAYTITHAIDDKNVLRFHIDYFKPEGESIPNPGEAVAKKAIIEAILTKHDAATGGRRFNALLATSSINDAIEYVELFRAAQAEKAEEHPDFRPLNIACVFSPPAQSLPDAKQRQDVMQLQEDLDQEREDNKHEPDKKKAALTAIIDEYNARYGTGHSIGDFDGYYKDVQKRIKDQQFPNSDLPASQKIDITIVVDMLLTGFDSKYLNTLYVDKKLRHHSLIQAFSRTNRVLNASKPYGNILDFRQQQDAVDKAIRLFSGVKSDEKKGPREIWLVDKAPAVIDQLKGAVQDLNEFMASQELEGKPEDVFRLRGDDARAQFINRFKEVQRIKTQLDQYTDLNEEELAAIEEILPEEQHKSFRGAYLETAQQLKEARQKMGVEAPPVIQALDFEFILFATALIDYDYIMNLIANFTNPDPRRETMTLQELEGLIESDAKFMDERELIKGYVRSLETGKALDEQAVRQGYQQYKEEEQAKEVATVAAKHGLTSAALQAFIDEILDRLIFDGEALTDLMEPLGLGWRERGKREVALMDDLIPLLKKRTGGRDISGIKVYEV